MQYADRDDLQIAFALSLISILLHILSDLVLIIAAAIGFTYVEDIRVICSLSIYILSFSADNTDFAISALSRYQFSFIFSIDYFLYFEYITFLILPT